MSWRFVLSRSTRIPTCLRRLGIKRNLAATSEAKSTGESHLIQRLFQGIIRGDRGSLAQAITLVETLHPSKYHQAQKLLARVVKYSKHAPPFSNGRQCSFRIGLSGPPGGGKSTFIETFGTFLTNRKHEVAVLAVDPSSSTTGGSLLGDKTRMTELSRNPNAYIRPSPSSGTLGNNIIVKFSKPVVIEKLYFCRHHHHHLPVSSPHVRNGLGLLHNSTVKPLYYLN